MQYLTMLIKEKSSAPDNMIQKKLDEGWEFDEYVPIGSNTVVIFRKK